MSVYDSIMKGPTEAVQYEKRELKNAKVNRVNIAAFLMNKDVNLLEKYAIMSQQ